MATSKQKAAMLKKVALTIKSGGKEPSTAEVMRQVGYSEKTARTPKKLTESNGWKELMERYLPDEHLTQKLAEGLEANKQLAARVVFKKEAPTSQSAGELPLASSSTDDFIEVPDFAVRHKYLETALKAKGKLITNVDLTSDGEKLEPTQIIIVEDNKTE